MCCGIGGQAIPAYGRAPSQPPPGGGGDSYIRSTRNLRSVPSTACGGGLAVPRAALLLWGGRFLCASQAPFPRQRSPLPLPSPRGRSIYLRLFNSIHTSPSLYPPMGKGISTQCAASSIAVRCIRQCSALHPPTQCAASVNAVRCICDRSALRWPSQRSAFFMPLCRMVWTKAFPLLRGRCGCRYAGMWKTMMHRASTAVEARCIGL